MNAEEIARFLRSHPQFFDQHPELLESILVPHPYGGRAIPLAERQAVALRDKVRLLEGKLGELIRFGEENDAISEKVQRLAVALVPLGESVVFGLLALGSEDPQRFFAEMGTLYLRRIGELCAAGVSARL